MKSIAGAILRNYIMKIKSERQRKNIKSEKNTSNSRNTSNHRSERVINAKLPTLIVGMYIGRG